MSDLILGTSRDATRAPKRDYFRLKMIVVLAIGAPLTLVYYAAMGWSVFELLRLLVDLVV